MSVAEQNTIERAITIAAPIDRVWRALTNTTEVAAWFQMRIEGTFAPGSDVWMTATHPEWAGQRFQVWIIEMTAPSRLVWQWHPGAVDKTVDYSREPRTTVTFRLEPESGGTRLTVTETGFDQVALMRRAKVFADNVQGWTEVVTWIKRHAEQSR